MKTLESHGVSYRKEGIFAADSWYETLRDAVILTGRCQRRVTYGEILEKIVMALSYPKHDSVEQSINESLDSVTADNAHDIASVSYTHLLGLSCFLPLFSLPSLRFPEVECDESILL